MPYDWLLLLPEEKKDRNSGRNVAMEAAMIAMPTSTLDQRTRSTVAKRKSSDVVISWIALNLIKVAMLPMFARHKSRMTDTFVRRFIFKPLTIKAGRMPKVQSPIEATTPWA
jgi:hypothetical protein